MAKVPKDSVPEDLAALQARVERLELEAREHEARLRSYEARHRFNELKAAKTKPA